MAKAARMLAALKRDGWATREDAERDCLSAIAFALEGDPQDYDTDAESLTFDVNVAPAA